MRIINRQEFLSLPPGVVFCAYEPICFGDLYRKGESMANDYFETALLNEVDADDWKDAVQMWFDAKENGISLTLDCDQTTRNGLFENEQLYVVYEQKDIDTLIAALNEARPYE